MMDRSESAGCRICQLESIAPPISGDYPEVIYQTVGGCGAAQWSWVRFTASDRELWCGQFQGKFLGAALSPVRSEALILTDLFLYRLDGKTGQLLEWMEGINWSQVTATPAGDFLIADDYSICRIESGLSDLTDLPLPVSLEGIEFSDWQNEFLTIRGTLFLSGGKQVELILDSGDDSINLKNPLDIPPPIDARPIPSPIRRMMPLFLVLSLFLLIALLIWLLPGS